jgi:hypothetical protein
MTSSGILRRVALVRTDVSEELSASFITVTRIGELGTAIAVTSNRRMLRRNTNHINVFTYTEQARGVLEDKTSSFQLIKQIRKRNPQTGLECEDCS